MVLLSCVLWVQSDGLKTLLTAFAALFRTDISSASSQLFAQLVSLEDALIKRYMAPACVRVDGHVGALVGPALGLARLQAAGVEVRGRVFALLLELVARHCQIHDVAPALVDVLMPLLAESIFHAYHRSLSQLVDSVDGDAMTKTTKTADTKSDGMTKTTKTTDGMTKSDAHRLSVHAHLIISCELEFMRSVLAAYIDRPTPTPTTTTTTILTPTTTTSPGMRLYRECKALLASASGVDEARLEPAMQRAFHRGYEDALKSTESQFYCFSARE